MMKIMTKSGLVVLFTASVLQACVTINIYFPAAAAEKAADKIIDDVWQLKNGEKDSTHKENTHTGEPAPAPETSTTTQ